MSAPELVTSLFCEVLCVLKFYMRILYSVCVFMFVVHAVCSIINSLHLTPVCREGVDFSGLLVQLHFAKYYNQIH